MAELFCKVENCTYNGDNFCSKGDINVGGENATREEGEAVGIEIAKEIIAYTEDFVDGYYFSFPFNRVYMLEKIMDK